MIQVVIPAVMMTVIAAAVLSFLFLLPRVYAFGYFRTNKRRFLSIMWGLDFVLFSIIFGLLWIGR